MVEPFQYISTPVAPRISFLLNPTGIIMPEESCYLRFHNLSQRFYLFTCDSIRVLLPLQPWCRGCFHLDLFGRSVALVGLANVLGSLTLNDYFIAFVRRIYYGRIFPESVTTQNLSAIVFLPVSCRLSCQYLHT